MSKIDHIAIIMDGNGRWAESRRHPRVWGHIRGAGRISDIVEEARDLGVKALTLFAFSTENWSRPRSEILTLFSLLKKFLKRERAKILRNNIRFRVIGEIHGLPETTKELILDLEERTKGMTGLNLSFAFDYGGRAEIVQAVNKFIRFHPGQAITEKELVEGLYNADNGDVDLLIRTGGDFRISNFLLWQLAYAELYFTPTKWPDFTTEEFRRIFHEVSSRERRFGGIRSDLDLMSNVREANVRKVSLNSQVE